LVGEIGLQTGEDRFMAEPVVAASAAGVGEAGGAFGRHVFEGKGLGRTAARRCHEQTAEADGTEKESSAIAIHGRLLMSIVLTTHGRHFNSLHCPLSLVR
jgi:hypothetical protein